MIVEVLKSCDADPDCNLHSKMSADRWCGASFKTGFGRMDDITVLKT